MSEKRIPVPLRAREFGGAAPRWMGWATFAVLLALWEMAVRAGWISRTFIASPAEIIVQLQNLLLSGELWLHLGCCRWYRRSFPCRKSRSCRCFSSGSALTKARKWRRF